MHFVVISLSDAKHRRAKITNLMGSFFNLTFFDAVDGRKGIATDQYQSRRFRTTFRSKKISQTERACSLSHHNVLCNERLRDYIVLEDDICDFDENLLVTFCYMQEKQSAIYILGGQEGLKLEYFFKLLWRLNFLITGKITVRVPFFLKGRIYRTCCYFYSNDVRLKLRNAKNDLSVADDWRYISNIAKCPIFFIPIFKHPRDLSDSTIMRGWEQEHNPSEY